MEYFQVISASGSSSGTLWVVAEIALVCMVVMLLGVLLGNFPAVGAKVKEAARVKKKPKQKEVGTVSKGGPSTGAPAPRATMQATEQEVVATKKEEIPRSEANPQEQVGVKEADKTGDVKIMDAARAATPEHHEDLLNCALDEEFVTNDLLDGALDEHYSSPTATGGGTESKGESKPPAEERKKKEITLKYVAPKSERKANASSRPSGTAESASASKTSRVESEKQRKEDSCEKKNSAGVEPFNPDDALDAALDDVFEEEDLLAGALLDMATTN